MFIPYYKNIEGKDLVEILRHELRLDVAFTDDKKSLNRNDVMNRTIYSKDFDV